MSLKRRNSCKIDTAKIELFENEITDGRVVFKPKETWTMDSIVILNTVQDAFYFHDTLSTSIINIVSCDLAMVIELPFSLTQEILFFIVSSSIIGLTPS